MTRRIHAFATLAAAFVLLPGAASAQENPDLVDVPAAGELDLSAARALVPTPAYTSRPGGWIALRPEVAVAVFDAPTPIVMQRGQVAVGGQGRHWSMYGTFDVGRLWFPSSGVQGDGAWLAQWGIVPAGVIRAGHTDVHIGGRLDLTAVAFLEGPGILTAADAGPMITLGPTVAFVKKLRDGPGIRVAIEPGVVLPWVTHTLALSIGMAY